MSIQWDSLTDVQELIVRLGRPAPTFGMAQLRDVQSWCGEVDLVVRARILSALVSADPEGEVVADCAAAIAALDQWRTLVLELLAAAHPGPAAIRVLREVLRAREIAHPLAEMAGPPAEAVAVHDALKQPEGLLVGPAHALPDASEWLLLATADPIGDSATAIGVRRGEGLLLTGLDAPWLEPDRAVCPAFFLLPA